MPFARLTLRPALPPETTQRLAGDLTDLIAGTLGKRQELTSVLIEMPAGGLWTIGAEARDAAAHLEVHVTAGTNTDEQKRTFIAEAANRLRQTLPGLDPASYVVVKELPGTDWGYDGRTQADRAAGRD